MLRSSFSVGRILGIDLRVHISFPVFLAALIGYSVMTTGGGLRGLGLWLALLFAVVVREVARSIAAAWSGLRLKALFLLPVGGVMALVQRNPGSTAVPPALPGSVAYIGPIANTAMGLLMAALCYAMDPTVPLLAQPWISTGHILRSFIWFQFGVALINLLPTATLPSSQMFRIRATRSTDPAPPQSSTPAFTFGTGLAFAMIVLGLLLMSFWPNNLWLILIGGFLLLRTHVKASQNLTENGGDSILVSDVMLTEYTLLSSSDTLQGAIAQTVHSLQDVFPVVRGNRLVGSVSRQTIADHLQTEGDTYLQGVMTRNLQLAAPTEKVVSALRRAASFGASEFIPVVEGDAMLGILTPQSLSRAVQQVQRTRLARKAEEQS